MIAEVVTEYREAKDKLANLKKLVFTPGAFVKVDCPQYTGFGIVSGSQGCDDDKLAVVLENGNTWWYPLECCKRVMDILNLPRYVRRQKLKMNGRPLLSIRGPRRLP